MNKYLFTIVLPACLFLASCIHPVEYNATDNSFTRQAAERKAWKTIAVLPFAGDLVYRRVTSEWFTYQLGKHGLFEIIGPGLCEVELRKHGIETAEADLPLETARKAGRMLGADAVLAGSVKVKEWQGPVVGASLVDVASGKVVATSIRSAPNMFTISGKKRSVAVTEQTAADIIGVLYDMAGKPRPQPPKKERPASEQKMPWSN